MTGNISKQVFDKCYSDLRHLLLLNEKFQDSGGDAGSLWVMTGRNISEFESDRNKLIKLLSDNPMKDVAEKIYWDCTANPDKMKSRYKEYARRGK